MKSSHFLAMGHHCTFRARHKGILSRTQGYCRTGGGDIGRGKTMKTSMLKTWVPMKISVLFAIAVFVAIAGQRTAQAQRYTNYPFCAVFDPQIASCSFNTMA